MEKTGIKIKGHVGKWYVIEEGYHKERKIYLLEHETFGDEAACLIVDKELNVVMDEVHNGLSDLASL